nr:MAG TPA: hypothetical protein [Caudoviricetes sp.]DAU29671.1 MAG TPA: hypothetical protein [Herelleviridae sp.]
MFSLLALIPLKAQPSIGFCSLLFCTHQCAFIQPIDKTALTASYFLLYSPIIAYFTRKVNIKQI